MNNQSKKSNFFGTKTDLKNPNAPIPIKDESVS